MGPGGSQWSNPCQQHLPTQPPTLTCTSLHYHRRHTCHLQQLLEALQHIRVQVLRVEEGELEGALLQVGRHPHPVAPTAPPPMDD